MDRRRFKGEKMTKLKGKMEKEMEIIEKEFIKFSSKGLDELTRREENFLLESAREMEKENGCSD